MKFTFKVVKANRDNNGVVTYDGFGFLRELQIFRNDKVVHKSDLHHPDGSISTIYSGYEFIVPRGFVDDVFVNVKNLKTDFSNRDKKLERILNDKI